MHHKPATARFLPHHKRTALSLLVGAFLCLMNGHTAQAQVDSPFQSPARPLGLNIVDKVKAAGSDSASATFKSTTLPRLRELARKNLGESVPLSNTTVGLHKIDPSKIKLSNSAQVRAYFVGEGAGYHNTLGFNSAGGGVLGGNPKLIFPDASTNAAESDYTAKNAKRTTTDPLLPGDFVNLGNFNAGTQLHFFNIANGANGGTQTFSTNHGTNGDGLVHAVAYTLPDSPYLLIGFEDLWGGGDRDYNDLLFTIDIGIENVRHLSGPEPSLPLLLVTFMGIVLIIRHRNGQPGGTTGAFRRFRNN